MKQLLKTRTDYILHYTVLFLSSLIITIGCICFPLTLNNSHISILLTSLLGGGGLYLLLLKFDKIFRPLSVFITSVPMLMISSLVWFQKESTSSEELWPLWCGFLGGAMAAQFIKHLYNRSERIASR